jgi:hypothetical protein
MSDSRELRNARRSLAEAEGSLGSREGLARLTAGLATLADLLEAGTGAEAATARNLAASYASLIYSRVGERLARDAQVPEPELEIYFKAVLAFDQVRDALPTAAAELKVALVRALIERYYEGHPPAKKRAALAELARLVPGL